ncbi:MAG: hypothetical protein GX662_08455 [Trichococcus flocculiformis]|uniref:Uncharacterized protein n=1 Tax=Trichococcus flocculiformis TaxID=82803 RepID=A0A847D5T7_9LACT|nr:hypothetical protein [Trichococcus flocculiformis]NLD32273.1 hypothetical protein [Trichococcus flocculiformis]
METRKQWTIRNKYIVTERQHETEISDFAIDTISGRMLGILFPFRSAHEQRIYAELESGIINIDQPCMEWLSESEKALYRKLEDQKASVNGMDKLLALFTDTDAAADFMDRYFSMYETPNLKADEVDLFGWDAVADEISNLVWQRPYEIGDFVEIVISRLNTKTGNPELITVGELVEKPTEEIFTFGADDIQFSGGYKFTN